MSLALSGVLLLGSVPVQAFATEEVVEEVLEEVVTEPQTTQQTQNVVTATDEVANTGVEAQSNPKVDYPLVVNDEQINSDRAADILENGTAVFGSVTVDDVTTNTLTLDNAQMESVVWLYYESNKTYGPELTVYLPEDTESTITEELKTEGDLPGIIRITGEGKLEVGHIDTCHLIIEKAVVEGKYGSDGYVRTAADGEFTVVEAETDIAAEGDYLEYVAASHVDWVVTDTQHYKICAEETCILRESVQFAHGGHKVNYSAEGMTIRAECEDCTAYKTFTLSVSDSEWGATEPNAEVKTEGTLKVEDPEISYQQGGTGLQVAPSEIGSYTVSMILRDKTVQNTYAIAKADFSKAEVTVSGKYVYNGQAHEPAEDNVSVVLNEKTLDKTAYKIVACKNNMNAGEAAVTVEPVDKEHYTGMAEGKFTITPKTIGASDVKLAETELTYNGDPQEPKVEIISDITAADFAVAEHEATANAGNYVLKVAGQNNYQGTVELPYTIAPAEAVLVSMEVQNIAVGSGAFAEPVCKIGEKPVEGTYRYSFDSLSNVGYEAAVSALAGITEEKELTVSFVFAPKVSGNIANPEILTGSFVVKLNKINFLIGNADITDQTVLNGNLTYGVTEPVSAAKIVASSKLADGETKGEYKVTYTKAGTSEIVTERPLPAGSYTFEITYTGTVNGVYCKDLSVYEGKAPVVIEPADIVLQKAPEGKHLIASGEAQDLIDAIVVTAPAAGATVEYKGDNGWQESIPQKTEPGRYTVEYKVTAANYKDMTGSVSTLIQPELTAVYGDTLAQVQGVPDGEKWKWVLNDGSVLKTEELGNHKVGDCGISDDFQMLYNSEETPFTVYIQVAAKQVTPTIEVAENIRYDQKGAVSVKVFETVGSQKIEIPAQEYKFTINEPAEGKKTGKTTITVEDNKADGNYEIAKASAEVLLYRPGYSKLTTLQSSDLMETEEYGDTTSAGTVKKVKEALSKKIESAEYPESAMQYFNVLMTYYGTQNGKTGWIGTRNLEYFPEGGFTIELPYSALGTGIDKNSDFRIAIMDAETSADLGTTAGNPPEEIEDFEKTEDGIRFHSDGCSVVCIATKVDLAKEYKISKSITLDGKTSTKGSLTVKVDSKTATKATYGTEVTVTAKANSGYSVVSVTVTDANGTTVKTEQDDSTYTFNMPASDVTVTMKLKKTTSTSQNPSSGDTSHIYLWLTMMAASVVGIVALVILWIKKRRK